MPGARKGGRRKIIFYGILERQGSYYGYTYLYGPPHTQFIFTILILRTFILVLSVRNCIWLIVTETRYNSVLNKADICFFIM